MSRPDAPPPAPRRRARNLLVVLPLLVMLGVMVGLTAESVTLYRIFCQVTGFGGTTRRADAAPKQVTDRMVTVRFNADVNGGMPWLFQPLQREVRIKVGETGMAWFRAQNLASRPVKGQATFNVTPDKTGIYFNKIQCFCFDEQVLQPGQSVDMPVTFFVDPKLADDRRMDDIRTITLSYTFFRAADDRTQTSDLAPPGAAATTQQ
ncbi:MAG: cytochrome c oxidase assembly protein [Dongiaceae bacterium]